MVVVTGLFALACGGEQEPSSEEPESVAQGLAVVDEGTYVSPDDPLVIEYQDALDSMSSKCSISEERIADMVVSSQSQLEERGIFDYGLRDVLEGTARLAQTDPNPKIAGAPADPADPQDECALLFTNFILQNS